VQPGNFPAKLTALSTTVPGVAALDYWTGWRRPCRRGGWYGVSDGPEAHHGARLRLARQARGLSQQQLANVAGVSRQAISLWESGENDPSLRGAFALASALGMTVEDLFGPGERAAPVAARPVAQLGSEGTRVTLASVRDGYVALPLRGVSASRVGFLPAGGLAVGAGSDRAQSRMVRPIGPLPSHRQRSGQPRPDDMN
jgi:transcriptional regulator with XRE-family HTH domain